MKNELIAIVGIGSIGSKHIDTLLGLGYTNLVGVDTKPRQDESRLPIISTIDELEYFKPTHGIICTPPDWHYHHAKYFVDRGIPVFIEKPLTVATGEASALLATAHMNKSIIAVGYMERAHGIIQSAKRYISQLRMNSPVTRGYIECYWRATSKTYMLDVARESSHAIDTAQYVFGKIQSVRVRSKDTVSCDLELICEDDVTVSVMMNMAADPLRKISVYTEKDAYVSTYGNSPEEWEFCYREELQAFLDGKPLCSGEDGLRVVKVLEAIQ